MSFLGPFEAFWPVVEPFVGSSERNRPARPHSWEEPAPAKPPKLSGISTWEKANSVKIDRITFGLRNG